MDTATSTLVPFKTYHITNPRTFRQNRLEILNGDHTILLTQSSTSWLKKTCITLHSAPSEQNGPVLAACRLRTWSKDLEVCLGDPEANSASEASFERVTSESFDGKVFRMHVGGRTFEWRRTHRKELGASRFGGKDFQLVDVEGNGQYGEAPLAVFVHTQSLFGRLHEIGRMEYFVELGGDLEVVSLVVLLGIQERISQEGGACA